MLCGLLGISLLLELCGLLLLLLPLLFALLGLQTVSCLGLFSGLLDLLPLATVWLLGGDSLFLSVVHSKLALPLQLALLHDV